MDLTNAFLSGAQKSNEFSEALDIISNNSSGNIWLIGGYVYRTIASELYGLKTPFVDLDFIVESPSSDFNLPKGWNVLYNRYDGPKLVNGSKEIDIVPLDDIHSIINRNLEPTIKNYLTGTPLTIQSIAYDILNNRVIGNIGINAIKEKTIGILNLHFALYASQKKGKSLDTYILDKAKDLKFTPTF